MSLSIRRTDGEAGWAREAADFVEQLSAQASATVIVPELYSVSRRGRSEVRANVAMIIAAADPAQALTVPWIIFRKASGGTPRAVGICPARE